MRNYAALKSNSHVLERCAPLTRKHGSYTNMSNSGKYKVRIDPISAWVVSENRILLSKVIWVARYLTSLRPVCRVQNKISSFAVSVSTSPVISMGGRNE